MCQSQKHEFRLLDEEAVDELSVLGEDGWQVVAVLPGKLGALTRLVLSRPTLSFQERVTMNQRQRYFASSGIEIEPRDGQ
jgi:hypothetical protein